MGVFGGTTDRGLQLMEYLLDNGANTNGISDNDDSYLHHCCDNANYAGSMIWWTDSQQYSEAITMTNGVIAGHTLRHHTGISA